MEGNKLKVIIYILYLLSLFSLITLIYSIKENSFDWNSVIYTIALLYSAITLQKELKKYNN